MEYAHFQGKFETGKQASSALHRLITKLLAVEADPLEHERRSQGLRRALMHEVDDDTGEGKHVVVASYDEEVVNKVADLVSGEARAQGPFTGHIEFDIRTATTAATGMVYTRQNDGPVILFGRKHDPHNRHSLEAQEAFEFARMLGVGLLWAELSFSEDPYASVERDVDLITLQGLTQFLGNYLPPENS